MNGQRMRPEFNSRRLFGITRSKGKMFELGLPESLHIAVPLNSEPQELFLLTVGTLGDVAATLSNPENLAVLSVASLEELGFSASFFDAFLESRFEIEIARDTALLASSAYYLASRPGSSLVLARQLGLDSADAPVDKLLHCTLLARWTEFSADEHSYFGASLENVASSLASHFLEGSNISELSAALSNLKRRAYDGGSARELLFVDLICAIVRIRLSVSAWTTLPDFTGVSAESWSTAIRRPEFPKELWPSQMLLGQAGLFFGTSGIVQMPTSAGKTRSIEIILRSGFLSGRTKLAVVVAPFRALCHEIGIAMRSAFRADDVKVNELSDAMQLDFLQQVAELLGSEAPASQYILVLTPEKLLYVLRHTPTIVNDIGIVVYDEGHQFDSGSRGITYELLLTQIKALLPEGAQTILVSAVIQNAQAIGEWLIGDGAQIVNGSGLLPTARSVAFSSWIERLGQLMFFESDNYDKSDFFVPRVIEQQELARRPRERAVRYFPEKGNTKDIALYLGIRLVPHGAVAIFCGRKDTASGIASRAVDVFERSFNLAPPAASADGDELRRMKNLIDGHFGDQSIASRAATLGVFVHHGTTPQGIRLSIEHAMQKGRINFVACTSTLAQGVNLPIRYLIVTGIYQAGEKIKVRDFQNLIGRAGRSGMHTEGLIIFSDPDVYDKRRTESWSFDSSVKLLSPSDSEATTSSLLTLLFPLQTVDPRAILPIAADGLCNLILSDEANWLTWATEVVGLNPRFNISANALTSELRSRRKLMVAVESYLMANRGIKPFEDFRVDVEQLAIATLAHHIADEQTKEGVRSIFLCVADYLQRQEAIVEKQEAYSKTLLGIESAKAIEQWVVANREMLLSLETNQAWLEKVWGLFSEESSDKYFHTVQPTLLGFQLASLWLQGSSYFELIQHSANAEGTKLWGAEQRRRLTDDETIDFCENTLGFECALILAAVAQFLFGNDTNSEGSMALTLFQKAFKYGLPDWLSVSCYEKGFADRVIALELCTAVRAQGFSDRSFGSAFAIYPEVIREVLTDYPSYFDSVLIGLS